MSEDRIEDIILICIMIFAFVVLCLMVATQTGALFWISFSGAALCLVSLASSISSLRAGHKSKAMKKGPAEAGPGSISSPQGKVSPTGDKDRG